MELHAALLPWLAALVAALAATLPFLVYRRPQRRAELALDLWLHPLLWSLVAAIVTLPSFAGLLVGIALAAAHPDPIARSAGIGLVILGVAPVPPLIGAVLLRRRRRAEARA